MVKVKVLGSLVEEAGFNERELDLKEGLKLIELLNIVFPRRDKGETAYYDMLILFNGVESSMFSQGFQLKLKEGDEVTVIPISHGG